MEVEEINLLSEDEMETSDEDADIRKLLQLSDGEAEMDAEEEKEEVVIISSDEEDVDMCEVSDTDEEIEILGEIPRCDIERSDDKRKLNDVRSPRKNIEWLGEGKKEKVQNNIHYKEAILDGSLQVKINQTVLISPTDSPQPYVGIVKKLYMTSSGEGKVHVQWFGRESDTVLGEDSSDPTQLFLLKQCDDLNILSIWKQCAVNMLDEPEQRKWKTNQVKFPELNNDGVSFWCQQVYDAEKVRFEYIDSASGDLTAVCHCNLEKDEDNGRKLISFSEEDAEISVITWDRAPMKAEDCVYIKADATKLKDNHEVFHENYDKEKYPEKYRKRNKYVQGSCAVTPLPFKIGRIENIFKRSTEVKISVRMFCRPEETHKKEVAHTKDEHELYWTDLVNTVDISDIQGRCWVKFAGQDESDESLAAAWALEGNNRFYFCQWYDQDSKIFKNPPTAAQKIGQNDSTCKAFPPVQKKLKSLDIFSGCGGLSEGLHQAGVAECWWAVDNHHPAAEAYRLNHPKATVFEEDCQLLLDKAKKGATTNETGQKIPRPGEVDFIVGGPPCQGFSGLNRFNEREKSQSKNELVKTFLEFCDYFKPKFFIMENVQNFAHFKKNKMLRHCIGACVRMGYQCCFGILQAGQYGLPQARRRFFLLAAAPGERLPQLPQPTHVFRPTNLAVVVGSSRLGSCWGEGGGAPFRAVTVRDCIGDLPEVGNGSLFYTFESLGNNASAFHRRIRAGSRRLFDHTTEESSPLLAARIENIPKERGSDWRDLPNKVVQLKDGSKCQKMNYLYRDVKQGRLGVCPCMEGMDGKCARQHNTLIPWCLAHTANKHNNWAGAFGRVEWDGYFDTVTTKVNPMGKQGRLLHPSLNRVLSVRECARAQGFPDTFRFYGSLRDMYRQIGNAVPPPLAKAIGLEVRRVLGGAR